MTLEEALEKAEFWRGQPRNRLSPAARACITLADEINYHARVAELKENAFTSNSSKAMIDRAFARAWAFHSQKPTAESTPATPR